MLGMPAKRIYSGSTREERGRLLHNSSEESQTTPGHATNLGNKDSEAHDQFQEDACSGPDVTHPQHVEVDVILCDAPLPRATTNSECYDGLLCEGEGNCPGIRYSEETLAGRGEQSERKWSEDKVKRSKSKSSNISGATYKTTETAELESKGEATSGEHKRRRSHKSTDSRSAGRGGCSPARPQLQKVIYYQNRFITIPIDGSPARAGSGASGKASAGELSAGSGLSRITEIQHGKGPGQAEQGGGATVNMASEGQGTSRVNMQPIVMDKKADPQPSGSRWSRRPTVLKKIAHYLQDNRLKTGSAETQEKLRTLNKTQEQSSPILKKILNIIFVTTGVSLLLAVVVVIIYTSIVTENPSWEASEPEASTDRVARDVSLVATRGKPGTNIGDRVNAPTKPPTTKAPTTRAPTTHRYIAIELEEWEEEQYNQNRGRKGKLQDHLIDASIHDYEHVNPSEDLEKSPGQTWGPVNKDKDEEEYVVEEYDTDGFIPVNPAGKSGEKDKGEKDKGKKNRDKGRAKDKDRRKNNGKERKPHRRPKGPVDASSGPTFTTTASATSAVPDYIPPPPDAIIDEYGWRPKPYLHDYTKNVRHPKRKQHNRRKQKERHRDDRLVGNVENTSSDHDT